MYSKEKQREYYLKNQEVYKAKRRAYYKEHREEIARRDKEKRLNRTPEEKQKSERCRLERGARNKAFIEAYKRQHPCVKCGEADPIVLDFHHTDAGTKEFRIAAVIWSHTIAAIEAEIVKCEVLCANCHRREHYRQGL